MLIHVQNKHAQVLDGDASVVISYHQSLNQFQLSAFVGGKLQCSYALTDATGIQLALPAVLANLMATSVSVGQ